MFGVADNPCQDRSISSGFFLGWYKPLKTVEDPSIPASRVGLEASFSQHARAPEVSFVGTSMADAADVSENVL